MAINARQLPDEEYFIGHKACQGCGASLVIRLALKIFGPRTYSVVPPNCMSTVGFIFPHMPFTTNAIIAPFAATAAVLSGIEAATRALGIENSHAIGFAGDGGTADIGIQALSGAIDRGDRMIYICIDNEAYMNTGIQKSGLTPLGAKTTTTPAGAHGGGSLRPKKNMFEIVAAHGIAYAATASVGYPEDYLAKLAKAKDCPGTSYIHVLAPCPTGWGTETQLAMALGREAVDCGLWYLAEYEEGAFKLNRNPQTFSPVADYLARQDRFAHLGPQDIDAISRQRDEKWLKIRKTWLTN